jgi:hypothetical protein
MNRVGANLVRAGAALLLWGCSDGTGTDADSPQLAFSYSGERSGAFHAQGTRPANDVGHAAFVVAFRTAAGELQVCAFQPTGGGAGNLAVFNLGPVTYPGSYLLPPPAQPGALSYQQGFAAFGVDSARTGIDDLFALSAGSIEISTLTTTRASGSLVAGLKHGELPEPPEPQLTISAGTFDLAIGDPDVPVICQ